MVIRSDYSPGRSRPGRFDEFKMNSFFENSGHITTRVDWKYKA